MTSNPETHTCPNCQYTWPHGQHGGHSCIERLRQQLEDMKRSGTPVVRFGQGENVTVNSRFEFRAKDEAAALTIRADGEQIVTLTFATQSHASDVLKALVCQRVPKSDIPTIHIDSGYDSVMTEPGSMLNPEGQEVTTLTISQGETKVRLTFPHDRQATEFLRRMICDRETTDCPSTDSARLEFMLQKCRKVVCEVLPPFGSGRYDVYVEEGIMSEKRYPATSFSGKWERASAEALSVLRAAIDTAIASAQEARP